MELMIGFPVDRMKHKYGATRDRPENLEQRPSIGTAVIDKTCIMGIGDRIR
jgi:hypothetical protein